LSKTTAAENDLLLDYFSNHPEYIVSIANTFNDQPKFLRINVAPIHPRYTQIIFPDGDIPDVYVSLNLNDLYVTDLGTVWSHIDMCLMNKIWEEKPRDEYLAGIIKNAAENHYIETQGSVLVSRSKDITKLNHSIEAVFNTIIQICRDTGLNDPTKPINT
jgi:hypothetical protein